MSKKIIIIGAGLCGTLLSLRLAQRGYQVVMYERRPDMRTTHISAGRSINLALSDRGIRGLRLAGVAEKVKSLVIPMQGRRIHPIEGDELFVKYSGREGEWINSISRGGLNSLLLDEADLTYSVITHFNTECQSIDFKNGDVTLLNKKTGEIFHDRGEVVFGTDGANSAVRNAMLENSPSLRFDYSQQYLETAYKELEIPAGENGSFRLESNALHIWPRPGFMMIALPNLGGSFTVTLFMSHEGQNSFENLKSDEEILDFFKKYFPTALLQMPDLLEDFRANPTSSLATVKCYPWQVNGRFLLMGDAAHAVVPFYGQGMNASFEDVVVLDELMDQYNQDWSQILPKYQAIRKIDTDAIADLAVENQYEMRDATADPVFQLKRKIELHLEQTYPDYFSKYSMVTFREDISYHVAMNQGRRQDRILMDYARTIGQFDKLNDADILGRLRKMA